MTDFQSPVTFFNARSKYLLWLLAALLLMFSGVALIAKGAAGGYLIVAIFGSAAFLFARMAADRRPRIVIDDSGIFDRTQRLGIIEWSDIVDAELQVLARNHFIALEVRNPRKYLCRQSALWRRFGTLDEDAATSSVRLNFAGIDGDPQGALALIRARSSAVPRSDTAHGGEPSTMNGDLLSPPSQPPHAMGQSFAIRFAGRFTLLTRSTQQESNQRLVGSAKLSFEDHGIRITARRARTLRFSAPFEELILYADILNVSRSGIRLSFLARRPAGGAMSFSFKAEDAVSAESLERALPNTRTALFARTLAEQRDFDERLSRLSPTAFVTPTIIAINVAIFVLMLAKGANPFAPDADIMVRYGANYGPLTTDGQWWRLISSTFLHFGLLHLGLNMWALYGTGRIVERLLGSKRFLVVYLFSGLTGSIASVLWNPAVLSAGASGAVFGVFGALAAFMLMPQSRLPKSVMQGHLSGAFAFIVYNLVFGATHAGIDNAAHVGGLVGGLLMGALLVRPLDIAARRRAPLGQLLLATVASALVLSAASWALTHPSVEAANEKAFRVALDRFAPLEAQAITRFQEIAKQHVDDASIGNQLASEVSPLWQQMHQLIAEPELAANGKLARVQAAYLQYIDHRRDGIALVAEGLKVNDREKFNAGNELLKRGTNDIAAIKTAVTS